MVTPEQLGIKITNGFLAMLRSSAEIRLMETNLALVRMKDGEIKEINSQTVWMFLVTDERIKDKLEALCDEKALRIPLPPEN